MRSFILGALALTVLAGCNSGQPKLWRIAIDSTPVRTIADPSCFKGNILPSGRGQLSEVNFRQESEWVIWDGVEGKQYLDIGTGVKFDLGDAPEICIDDLIEGSEKVFSAQRNEVKPYGSSPVCKRGSFNAGPTKDATESRQTQIVVSWNDLGASPTGTLQLTAQYACVGGRDMCPSPNDTTDSVSCRTQLNFVGRRIDWSQVTSYGNIGAADAHTP